MSSAATVARYANTDEPAPSRFNSRNTAPSIMAGNSAVCARRWESTSESDAPQLFNPPPNNKERAVAEAVGLG
jgi:hypothetical protein